MALTFIPGIRTLSGHDASDLWFVFDRGKLLTRVRGGCHLIPDGGELGAAGLAPLHGQYLGQLDGCSCYGARLPKAGRILDGFQLNDLRSLFSQMDQDLIWIAGRANHLLHWHSIHRYCGRCGAKTIEKKDERALACPDCGLVNYPRLSPAVIVAVHRDGRILLARNKQFRRPFYSVLAGFVEPGETLEDCVQREIKEEVGITVKEIRYFGSQPWPFPDSLMVGFTADYAGGKIVVDNDELVHAAWFSKDELPRIPPPMSIARQLIDAFAKTS